MTSLISKNMPIKLPCHGDSLTQEFINKNAYNLILIKLKIS